VPITVIIIIFIPFVVKIS